VFVCVGHEVAAHSLQSAVRFRIDLRIVFGQCHDVLEAAGLVPTLHEFLHDACGVQVSSAEAQVEPVQHHHLELRVEHVYVFRQVQ